MRLTLRPAEIEERTGLDPNTENEFGIRTTVYSEDGMTYFRWNDDLFVSEDLMAIVRDHMYRSDELLIEAVRAYVQAQP